MPNTQINLQNNSSQVNPEDTDIQQIAPNTLTRQQLYDRIKETTKDEYILKEMIRLGYWKEDEAKPSLSATLIKEEGELQKRLNELLAKQKLIDDPQKALQMLHKERKKVALERREFNKQLKNQQRYDRAIAWYEAKQKDLMYLGSGTGLGLCQNESNALRLAGQGLPDFKTGEELASAMGVSINELRFLSYDRKTTKVNHYQQFLIAKKTGGMRRISAPMPRLKRLQYWILGNILDPIKLHDCAHGFVSGRSIISNAKVHVGKDLVINMDLQDFFPTITYRRIKGMFVKLGYSEKIATVLALLCSEPDRDEVILDDESYHTARTDRYLPQGAPTSPAISNIICRKLDRRIQGIADKLNFNYTRYADDLTFSYNGNVKEKEAPVTKLLWRVQKIISDEGFIVHPSKTRIMRLGSCQEVTGIVVNEKLSINRATLKRFRSLLFQIDKDGIQGKHWGNINGDRPAEMFRAITGYANFIKMVDYDKGSAFLEKVHALKAKYKQEKDQIGPTVIKSSKQNFRQSSVAGKSPYAIWWDTKTPVPPFKSRTATEIYTENKQTNIEYEAQFDATQYNNNISGSDNLEINQIDQNSDQDSNTLSQDSKSQNQSLSKQLFNKLSDIFRK